jgi:isopentenyl-diphosphate Delta-isomerase
VELDVEELVLVSNTNRYVGTATKQLVHLRGLRHRAFSVFLANTQGEVLLQRRHPAKYHSGGLWANTCCGHPKPGERTYAAARRRLFEELGVARAKLRPVFRMHYQVEFENGLQENEFVYVYAGTFSGVVRPNPQEIDGVRSASINQLAAEIAHNPSAYTYWLRLYLSQHRRELENMIAWLSSAAARSS